ncbi:methionyl aminopeptidase [Clostridium sp. 'deep sea']|uniref:methionyl aminopeptidase n=1 Tax=Clostridium sp. 'deep sea' TaxID=2779445 RepID=UPI001896A43E|nr:methionyl aminopeptidase [Clostridium sp. 'deep sea']QOR34948.1 methionyl aminopeptidase [Clostridium sp. 'deep sea']
MLLNRNDFCWCGSGKKYKHCHIEKDSVLSALVREGYILPPTALIKTKEQIAGIRKSAVITTSILDNLQSKITAGITTQEIDKFVYDYTLANGAIPAPLNYNGYPKSCCTSINEVICHGIPGNTVLKNGDIINVDISTILGGYFSDASRTYMVGDVIPTAKKLIECTKECLYLGIENAKPYQPINNIGKAIQKHANSLGFSVVQDYGGHGIGLEFHEEPFIPHFNANEKLMILLPGMTITVEPMINEGLPWCDTLKDNWTVVTHDKSLSAQWEHTILITETGAEILT